MITVNRRFTIISLLIVIMVLVVSFFPILYDNSIDEHSELRAIPRPKNERRKEQNEIMNEEHIVIEIHQSSKMHSHIIYFLQRSSKESVVENIFHTSSKNLAKFCSSTGIIFWEFVKLIAFGREKGVNEFIFQFRDAERATRFLNSFTMCLSSFADDQDLHKTSNLSLLNILDSIFTSENFGIKFTGVKMKVNTQINDGRYHSLIQGFFRSTKKCFKLKIRGVPAQVLLKSCKKRNIDSFRRKLDTIERMEKEFSFDQFFSKTKGFLHKFDTTPSSLKAGSQIFVLSIPAKKSQNSTQILIYLEANSTLLHWYTELRRFEVIHSAHRTGAYLQFAPPRFLSVMLRRLRSPMRNKTKQKTSTKFGPSTESHPSHYKRSASLSSSKHPRQKKNDITVSQDFNTKTSPLKPFDNQSQSANTKGLSEVNYSLTENVTSSSLKLRHVTTKKMKQNRRNKTYTQRDNQTEYSMLDHILSTKAYFHLKTSTPKSAGETLGSLDSSQIDQYKIGKHSSSSTIMENSSASSTHRATPSITEIVDSTTRSINIENNSISPNHRNILSTSENADLTMKNMNSENPSLVSVHRSFQNTNEIVDSTMKTVSTESTVVSTNHKTFSNTSEISDSSMKTVSVESVPMNLSHLGISSISENESTMKVSESGHKMKEPLSKTEATTEASHKSSEKLKSLRNAQQIALPMDPPQNLGKTTDIPNKAVSDFESVDNDHDSSEHEKTTLKPIKTYNLEPEEKVTIKFTTEESEPPHASEQQQETNSLSSIDDHSSEKQESTKQEDNSGVHKTVTPTSHLDSHSDSHQDLHQDSHHESTQMPVSSYHHYNNLAEVTERELATFSPLSSSRPSFPLISQSQFPSASSPSFQTPLHSSPSSASSFHFSLQSSSYPSSIVSSTAISRTTFSHLPQHAFTFSSSPLTSPIPPALTPTVPSPFFSSHSQLPTTVPLSSSLFSFSTTSLSLSSPSSSLQSPISFPSSSIPPPSSLSSTQSPSSTLFHHPPEQPSFNTTIEENPWLVAIRGVVFMGETPLSENVVFLCEGSIIDPHWVLTAASCFKSPIKDTSYRNITVSVGSTDWKGPHIFSASKTIHHEDYYHKSDSDTDQFQVFGEHNIGLIYTESSLIADNENVHEIDTMIDPNHELPNYLFLAGWADTSNVSLDEGIVPVSRTLREIRIHPITADKCTENIIKMNEMSKDKYIPASDKSNIHEICSLDELDYGLFTAFAGAPLVDKTDLRHPKQVGIASYKLVFSNNHPDGPKIYSQVAHFSDWIKRTIAANS
ncbi:uncharacterized protein LOC141857726 isoform X2 [Brevipalpus obovatus]|uniref:uncharacterized protein LOC141857726 isoform X2 n=1 Tax=Brevipalpus obovatus TaxID=246614 RepID=UPI003D9F04CF